MNVSNNPVIIFREIPRSKYKSKYKEVNGEITDRECTGCGEMKNLDLFSKRKSGFAGRRTTCKKCSSKEFKDWREDNIVQEKARRAKYYADNRGTEKEYSRDYGNKNSEKVAMWKREWQRINSDKRAEQERSRRYKLSLMPNNLTEEDKRDILRHFNNSCALTGSTERLEMDHVVPISTGRIGTTKGNIIPLTSKINISKGSSNIFDWYNENGERLNISSENFNYLVTYLAEINGMSLEEYRKYVEWCFNNPKPITELDGGTCNE